MTPYAEQPAAPVTYDLPLEALATYQPEQAEPEDFDAFWKQSLTEAAGPPAIEAVPVTTRLSTLDAFDVTFAGFAQQPVKAWLTVPAGTRTPLPCVVQFVGYGDGRGDPIDHLLWASAGYAHLVMDARGQGGSTPDLPGRPGADTDGPPVVRGLTDPADYYYRRVFMDAVGAVAAARALPLVDAERIVLVGGSQGGGIALAAAALTATASDDGPAVAAVLCDVPFLCHWERAVRLSDRGPYAEVARYCARHRDRAAGAMATLRYFDGVAFATRATAPALFSVALMDRVCPPSTVYAAYNHYAGDKRIAVWEFNDHEGGGSHQTRLQLDFLAEILSRV
ncbi:MAG TPA: acetylxylan esterase [Jiangellales bacterium]|nr:acetylxylan esterase [Jiangellales bacterium]